MVVITYNMKLIADLEKKKKNIPNKQENLHLTAENINTHHMLTTLRHTFFLPPLLHR